MKKILILIHLLLIIPLCGCERENELGNDDIITAFYVNLENSVYEISAEILDFENEKNAVLKTAHGETLQLAYANLMKSLKKSPYPGHAGSLIFGSEICVSGLKEAVSFFSDINIISPNISLMLTEDSFSDFKPLSIYDATKKEALMPLPLYTLFIPENKTAFIPVISCIEGEPENTGGIIAEDFIFRYYIDEKSSDIYRLLTNSFKKDFYGSNEILKSKCKLKNKNNLIKAEVNLEIKNLTQKDSRKIASELSDEISDFAETLKENGLCSLLKKGEFQNVQTDIKITVPDMGKLKKQEEK